MFWETCCSVNNVYRYFALSRARGDRQAQVRARTNKKKLNKIKQNQRKQITMRGLAVGRYSVAGNKRSGRQAQVRALANTKTIN